MDAVAVARDLLDRLGTAVSGRDAEATLALFAPSCDVVLLGSEAGEQAYGWDELRAFLAHLYARPIGFGWEWSRVVADRRGDVLWFVASGNVVETVGDARSRTPYRFSGVAVGEPPRLAVLHGSEPVPPKS
ncbi:MAG TPA: nuclear transport factor 2 family protein [Mycobacteriales bacterium]|jgi:hypothetical protein|nr:nuclear transport factor 2 family protein [Mycobacteriales bacterium]